MSQSDINRNLIVHHRSVKTGAVIRRTPYNLTIENGVQTYERDGVLYNADFSVTGTDEQALMAAKEDAEALKKAAKEEAELLGDETKIEAVEKKVPVSKPETK